jgi:hypothetical protein
MPNQERYEANNGGDEYAESVDKMLREDGIHINISHKKAPTTSSKLGRIIQYAPDIKKFYFLDDKHQSKEYRAFMKELTTFVQNGKILMTMLRIVWHRWQLFCLKGMLHI